MDMEFSKYLISLNKLYYPSFLNYILIYEMPWVLNGRWNIHSLLPQNVCFACYHNDRISAAFKIIKSWLPARAVQKIKFINRNSIKEYVNSNKMLPNWGGEDDYSFAFVPEVRIEFANSSCSPYSTKTEETKKKSVSSVNMVISMGLVLVFLRV